MADFGNMLLDLGREVMGDKDLSIAFSSPDIYMQSQTAIHNSMSHVSSPDKIVFAFCHPVEQGKRPSSKRNYKQEVKLRSQISKSLKLSGDTMIDSGDVLDSITAIPFDVLSSPSEYSTNSRTKELDFNFHGTTHFSKKFLRCFEK